MVKKKRLANIIVDGEIEFVSLVGNGANRTPFKIIKSEEGDGMKKKVVQRVVIPNALGDDAAAKILDGFRDDELEESKNYKSYIQVPLDCIKEESIQLAKTEDGAYMVVGELAEDSDLKDAVEINQDETKEELEWTTLDDVFNELYALEGIISGTLRQKSTTVTDKAATVLSAVDTFRTGLEIALSVVKYEVEDVPEAASLRKTDNEDVKTLIKEALAEKDGELDKIKADLEAALSGLNELKTEIADKEKELKKKSDEEATSVSELADTIKELKEEIAVLKKQPRKSNRDTHEPRKPTKKAHIDDYYTRY